MFLLKRYSMGKIQIGNIERVGIAIKMSPAIDFSLPGAPLIWSIFFKYVRNGVLDILKAKRFF